MVEHPPRSLLDRARAGGAGLHVLADWYEEHEQPGWARWLRLEPLRWRGLARALDAHGGRIQRLDAGFLWAPDRQPAVGQDHLLWRVRDPEALDLLLGSPVGYRASELHLTAWRARTAVPRVLEQLQHRRAHLRVLEITGTSVEPGRLVGFRDLERLTFRPAAGPTVELPVVALHLRLRSPNDLEAFRHVRTPKLEQLYVTLDADGRLPAVGAELASAFDRPFARVSLDSGLRAPLAELIARVRPDARMNRSIPRSWEQDWNRWLIDL